MSSTNDLATVAQQSIVASSIGEHPVSSVPHALDGFPILRVMRPAGLLPEIPHYVVPASHTAALATRLVEVGGSSFDHPHGGSGAVVLRSIGERSTLNLTRDLRYVHPPGFVTSLREHPFLLCGVNSQIFRLLTEHPGTTSHGEGRWSAPYEVLVEVARSLEPTGLPTLEPNVPSIERATGELGIG